MNNKIEETISFYTDRLKKHSELCRLLEKYPELPSDEYSEEYNETVDLLLHITLLGIDVDISCKYFLIGMLESNQEEMRYFGRSVALHCITILDNGQDCLPARVNNLSKMLLKYPHLGTYLVELGAAKKQITNLHKQHLLYLKSIRNTVYAHRTGKGIEQNVIIGQIDPNKLGLVTADILDAMETIIATLLKILKAY